MCKAIPFVGLVYTILYTTQTDIIRVSNGAGGCVHKIRRVKSKEIGLIGYTIICGHCLIVMLLYQHAGWTFWENVRPSSAI